MLSIFNEVFFFKVLCAVCQRQDFLQVTSIQGTQMRRRNGLGISNDSESFSENPPVTELSCLPNISDLGMAEFTLLDRELDT